MDQQQGLAARRYVSNRKDKRGEEGGGASSTQSRWHGVAAQGHYGVHSMCAVWDAEVTSDNGAAIRGPYEAVGQEPSSLSGPASLATQSRTEARRARGWGWSGLHALAIRTCESAQAASHIRGDGIMQGGSWKIVSWTQPQAALAWEPTALPVGCCACRFPTAMKKRDGSGPACGISSRSW